ncbi:hypothetical protein GUITHDRAFT_73844 [Guillardia theta CCMP2712]|uniref:Uncharacterized protein n=1 Tax=Guillardia theta (strain CCMP2712) TaxID=905079 RepID=L1J2M2_GUITC|nr:hypothetical protein GUITHDRAFT_73844 [Guillardia theta CCMP2712]EKX42572.1 hypothetical protein GUITHDRAFT_73844 [Guillardia theta CCMP2712]|eukprot:XP_005829552.1 hypothetical protein GUITHDRAFT_73844 [Guillardia theta CCMP2712]
MSILITIIFSLVATISFGFLLYPYIDHWTERKFSKDVDLPLLGPVPLLAFFVAPLALLVVALWLCTKHWIANDVLAISLVVFFLANIRLSSLMVATVLLLLAFCYDIFWVFMSSSIFGKNVMVTVATDLDVPIKILIPLVLTEETKSQLEFTLIGLGDIVLPGLLLCFAWRVDCDKGIDMQKGYFAVTMAGYLVALTLCEIIVGSLHLAQPAMIYLVPGTLIPFTLLALVRKEFTEVWNGVEETPIAAAPEKP